MSQGTEQLRKAFRVIEQLEAEVAALRKAQAEPIAIVGLSCRFPGAESADAYWSLLRSGGEGITEVPPERWDIDSYYDPDPDAPGKMSTRFGGFLKNVDQFDAQFFNISPREAALMDPQQRLLLELSWEAMENAGLSPDDLYGSPTGVFAGVCVTDYGRMAIERGVENLNAYWGTGHVTSVAAGRLAYTFGFTGPCISVDTACSAALVAVHTACDSLRKGECDAALAVSANFTLAPECTVAFSKARMMSPDGRCQTFDERANGYVRSEGAAVLVLKTLSKARADGDTVFAVIRGSAINQDGASGGLTVPNGPSQVSLIREALSRAGIQPEQVDYIEAHGTGTALGDPIEVGALGEVFGASHTADRPLLLGSAKAVVGHMELAAGMAGLIKVVLSLQNGTIPGQPLLRKLSSRIPWHRLPFAVPTECRPWPKGDKPRIAGVSAFGFSGTNAHVVVQEAPLAKQEQAGADAPAQPSHVLCLSAKTPDALTALAQRYADWLRDNASASTLDAVCWTANTGRARFSQRLAVTAASPEEMQDRLATFARTGTASGHGGGVLNAVAPATERQLAFLFSGQGSQYAGMGRGLYELHPQFRAAIDRCGEVLAAHLDVPLTEILWGRYADRLNQTAYTQPALFSLEYALATLWRSWGVAPAYVMGHSVGEFAAACVAGIFSLEDGLELIAARGRLMQALPRDAGAMAVVVAGQEAVEPEVERFRDCVSIAAFNAPDQTVISGDRGAVLELCERLQSAHGIRNKGLLDVSHAFHSPLMQPMLADFRAVAERVQYSRPEIGFISNVSGRLAGGEVATAQYWVDHVLAPVDFMGGIRELESSGVDVLVEIGPKAILIGLAQACCSRTDRLTSVASLRQNASDWSQMLHCLGTLFVNGLSPDWRKAGRCDQPPPAKLVLPTYPFQRQRHWLSEGSGPVKAAARRSESGGHQLLGQRLLSAALPAGDFQYEAVVGAQDPKYLQDHRVYEKVVVPGAAYVEMTLAGIARQFPGRSAMVTNFSVQAALVLPSQGEMLVQSLFSDAGANLYRVKLFSTPVRVDGASDDAAQWQLHAAGEIELLPDDGGGGDSAPEAVVLDWLHRRFEQAGERLDVQEFYRQYATLGLQYGGNFQTVRRLSRIVGDDEASAEGAAPSESLAQIVLPEPLRGRLAEYVLHPALLDGCFQSVGAMFPDQGKGLAYLPVGIEKLRVWQPSASQLWAHATMRRLPQAGDPRVVADIRLLDAEGKVIATVEGLQAVPVERQALAYATATWKDKFYAVDWVPQPRGGETMPTSLRAAMQGGGWLVLSDRTAGGVGEQLAARLTAQQQSCVLVRSDEIAFADKAAWTSLIAERFGSASVPLTGIVHLWALDEAAGEDGRDASPAAAQDRLCGSTLALIQALMDVPNQRLPRLWLVTQGAQPVADTEPSNVAHATLWGFGRTIAVEHPALNCTCIDLEPRQGEFGDLATDLLHPEPEAQIGYRGGKRYVARLNRVASVQARNNLTIPADAYRLRMSEYGSLDRMTLLPMERVEPADHEVEIEVCASAINFKDVLFSLGMLRSFSERLGITRALDQPLGFECAGRIVRVGSAVTGLAVGDEVFAMAASTMASHVTVDQRLVHRKPRNLTFEEAASLPTVFMTAIYSLEKLARIKAGDTVLIHAGAGGVGQAALQIARKAGATVFATASPGKWTYLKRQGVAHVMNSRTLDFADEIMRLTGGRGVDVVLNSLAGEYIAKSADVVAKGGRFVEIGKIDIWDKARMAAYRPDISYFSFDLGDLEEGQGELLAELLTDVVGALEEELLTPLPVKPFPIQQAEAAFRYLAQAKNIGKVVLSMPAGAGQSAGVVRPDRSYLITGGLGALGLHVAESLIAGGARQIVLTGRSAPDENARKAIDALSGGDGGGVQIHVKPMDVADPAQVSDVLGQIAREMNPLGGIVHAAGMLDDGVIVKQSWERFANVLAPKVAGAWNLHAASAELKLDFFVMFSSIASIMGAPGQGNYSAANAFMDALMRYRRSRGLPATCINWGPWAAGGMAERTRGANRARFESLGLGRMPVEDSLEVFEHLLENQPSSSIAVLDMNWTKYLKTITSSAAANFYSLLDKSSALAGIEEAGALLNRLLNEPEEAREAILIDHLRRQVAGIVGLASPDRIDLQQPLLDLGIDSLMAVELKNRIESSLSCTLNPTLLFDYPTLDALGSHLARDVLKLASSAAPQQAAPGSAAEDGVSDAAAAAEADGSGEPLATMQEFSIDADGRKLGVCRWGTRDSAPLAICVHGILDQAAIWDEVAVGLVENGYRVMALDLRGHGRSDHHPGGANLTAMDFLIDLRTMVARTAAGSRPFTLVGHSLGSVVCGLFAGLHPEKVDNLIMIEPVVPFIREMQSALDYLSTDLRYVDETPTMHPVYPDLATAARMLTLNHGSLSPSRSLKLAQRITEPCEGGLRWRWDARMRNPLGINPFLTKQHYLSILKDLKVSSTRIYGTASQFGATSVLLDADMVLPLSRSEHVAGGHNLHTENPAGLLQVMLDSNQPDHSRSYGT
jgi:myxalamid-type polyketide synthase MxaB